MVSYLSLRFDATIENSSSNNYTNLPLFVKNIGFSNLIFEILK